MNSPSKNPLQRQQIAELVKGEVDGLQGIMKKMLANKIGFFEAQQQNIKQNTPGVSQMPSTTNSVNFMISFKEQVEDIELELLNAPSNDTIRRVRALIANAKSNFAKLDSSDVKKALDMLLELAVFTVVEAPRTHYKGEKSKAVLNKSLTVTTTKGKMGDIRRYAQDLLIKGVHQLAGQFLHNADYPRNYEELRDYFDINERGAEIANKINKMKADIFEDRERMLKNAEDKAVASAVAAVEKANAEQEMAAQLAAADAGRVSKAKLNMNQEASAIYSQLPANQDDAFDAIVMFAATMYDKPIDVVFGAMKQSDIQQVLLDAKEFAATHKVSVHQMAEAGKQLLPILIQAIAEGQDIDPVAIRRLLMRPLASLEAVLNPPEIENVRRFEAFSKNEMIGYLLEKRPDENWNQKYLRNLNQYNKTFLTKIYILEGLFSSDPQGNDEDDQIDGPDEMEF